jgi:2,4-dienoyl-CoA reductase-like NADH-dependent reductase (Old Yellow Enzyme family)
MKSLQSLPLSTPLSLPNGAVVPNRIAKAAMEENMADGGQLPGPALRALYAAWARGGAGLILTGNVMIDGRAMTGPGGLVLERDTPREPFAAWAHDARAHGAQVWMQINHPGRQVFAAMKGEAWAPSAVALDVGKHSNLFAQPRAMTEGDIAEVVTRFADTAQAAEEAGFTGVQIHAAHGYLISQFLSPLTNLRDDAWGGDATRRSRFLLEIVRAVRAAVGPAFPVGVKLNSADFQRGGFTIDAAMDVVRALETAGIDLLEVSGGNYESPAMAGSGELANNQRVSSRYREAYFLDYARQLRTITKLPILLTGGMRSRAVMEDALASGATDVIGLARPMAHTPELPAKLLDGSLAAAPVVKLRSRIRLVDDAIQVMWYQQQITALSLGRDPDPALGIWTAFWRGLRDNMLPGKRRPAAAAAARAAKTR